jgi:hypothetical protein
LFDDAAEGLRKAEAERSRAAAEKAAALREAARRLADSLHNSKYVRETYPKVMALVEHEDTVVITRAKDKLAVKAIDANTFESTGSSVTFQGDENRAARNIIKWIQARWGSAISR